MRLGKQHLLLITGLNREVGMCRREDLGGSAPRRLGELARAVKKGVVEVENDASNFCRHSSKPQ